MRLLQKIRGFLRLPPDIRIEPQVREHFRRNYIANALDQSVWLLGESFVSVNTIVPVFASTLTDSAILIGLVPALIHAGWFIPQVLMAGYIKRLPRKMPFARAMAKIERIPYLILPLTAFLLHWISREFAIWLFMIVIAWRGIASGMVALPWQEVIATVIPSPVRSRFFGVARTVGRTLGVVGSVVAGFILAELSYPNNYALCFLIGAAFVWLSYFFFTRTIEPEVSVDKETDASPGTKVPLIDFPAFKTILKRDLNLRKYLTSRIFFQLGSMAVGFFAVYGIQRFSLADEQAAVFSGLLFVSGILGFVVWGVVGDQFGPRNILLTSDVFFIIALVLAYFSPSVWGIYGLFLVFGFAQSGHIIGELVLGMGLGPEGERPIYLGLVRSIPGVFVLIAPLIGGTLVEWVGYQAMFIVALGFGLVGMAFVLQVKNPKQI
jgi:MFS family permease